LVYHPINEPIPACFPIWLSEGFLQVKIPLELDRPQAMVDGSRALGAFVKTCGPSLLLFRVPDPMVIFTFTLSTQDSRICPRRLILSSWCNHNVVVYCRFSWSECDSRFLGLTDGPRRMPDCQLARCFSFYNLFLARFIAGFNYCGPRFDGLRKNWALTIPASLLDISKAA